MAGIYIHIPFCKQACSYCDFHFSTNLSRKQDVLHAIVKEISLQKDYLQGEVIETIYLGGGTPSLLNNKELMLVFEALYQSFNITQSAEISLEANPDDLSLEKLRQIKQTPINRLSIGVQSFFDEDLQFMNRAHNAKESLQAIQHAQEVGFNQLSIDLIFGGQTTSNAMWERNLEQFFQLDVPHLSAYSLTVEEKTTLAHQVNQGIVANVDDQKNYEQYMMLQSALKDHQFEQYELSNYCKDQQYSQHNTSYWLGKKYLGLGPSAHSFDGYSRQWNFRNNALYCKAMQNETIYFEKELLSEIDRYHEYLITSLRTIWGVHIPFLTSEFNSTINSHFNRSIQQLDSNMVELSKETLVVKKTHLFQSDEVVRTLMMDHLN